MSFGEAAFKLLKEQLLPEIGEIKQELGGVKVTLGALINRLDSMERESIRRFEQIDKRFELLEKRIEDQGAEHSRRMDLLDKRIEGLETAFVRFGDRQAQLAEAVSRLALLGDYVRRIDDMAAELRELRRRQDEFERRVTDEVLPRLPKVET